MSPPAQSANAQNPWLPNAFSLQVVVASVAAGACPIVPEHVDSNKLLVVLRGERGTQAVVNTGSLY
jgi:hypothetical protein